MSPNTKKHLQRDANTLIGVSDCFDSESVSGGSESEATYSNSYTPLPPSRPRKKKRGPNKRGRGRPKSRQAAYRRSLPKRHQNVIPWAAIKAIQRADRKATATKQPLDTFVSIRWVYSKHHGKNPALMVNRFFAAAQAFFKRSGHHFSYISTMENPSRSDDGFHTHLMIHVPQEMIYAFPEWLRSYVSGDPKAVDIRPRCESIQFKDRRTRLNYMLKACEYWVAELLGMNDPIINPSGRWDFLQGKMPSGLRRWRVSADLMVPANRKERPPKLFDADGDDIKTIRNSLGWSTQRLADAAGINRNSVINLEKPGKIPVRRAYAARRIEKAYQQAGFSFELRCKAGHEQF